MKKQTMYLMCMVISIIGISCQQNSETVESGIEVIDDVTEYLEFEVAILDGVVANEDYRTKWIEAKFNVNINIIPLTMEDSTEKARAWLNTGKLPDVLWLLLRNGNILEEEFTKMVEQGIFQAIPYESYPHLNALYRRMQDIIRINDVYDGDIYYWTTFRNFPEEYFPMDGIRVFSLQGWLYRRDWAEKLGLAKENNIYTFDEFVNLIRAFKEKDPGNNGRKENIGAVLESWAFPEWIFKLYGLYPNNVTLTTDADGKYIWEMELDEIRESIKDLKRLYDAGIWSKQHEGRRGAARQAFAKGLSGAFYSSPTVENSKEILESLRRKYPNTDIEEIVQPLFIKNDEGFIYQNEEYNDHWGGWVLNSNMSHKKISRWMNIMNYLAGEEGRRLILYGIPEQDYELDEDGNITLLWENDEQGNLIKPFTFEGSRFLSLAVLNERYEVFSEGVDPFVGELYKINKRILETEKKGKFLTANYEIAKLRNKIIYEDYPLPKLENMTRKFLINLVTKHEAKDFDRLYDEFLRENKQDAKRLIDKFNSIKEEK